MPDWLTVILLGIIEGITEFLPISSTGHLLLVQNNGWLAPQSDLFNTGIQSGAVLAVILVFAGRVRQMVQDWRQPETRDYIFKLAAAFGITAVGGLMVKKLGWELPSDPRPVILATLIGGIAILIIEWFLKHRKGTDRLGWMVVAAIGIAQLVAGIFPGTSRSGATILTAMAFGVARPSATEFSFLLGIPTLVGAGAFEAVEAIQSGDVGETAWSMVALGFVVSAITAFAAVKWLLKFVQSHTFNGFGWYRIALAIVILLITGW